MRLLLVGMTAVIIFIGCDLRGYASGPSTSREAALLMTRTEDLMGRIDADVVRAFDAFQQAERIAARATESNEVMIAEKCCTEVLRSYRLASEAATLAELAIASYSRSGFDTTKRLSSVRQIYADVSFSKKIAQEHADWAEKHSQFVMPFPKALGAPPTPL